MVWWINLIFIIVIGVFSLWGLSQGINLLTVILENGTTLIGILSAIAGLYFLFFIYRKTQKNEDKWLGIALLIIAGIFAIGTLFIDLLRILFSNTIVLVLAIGFLILVYLKKEGILK